MATRSRLPGTTNAGMVETTGVTRGGNGSLATSRLVVTADAAEAAASAALAAASQAAAAASQAAAALSAAASLTSANNADISEAAAAASAAAAAASEAAAAAAVAVEAAARIAADALLMPKTGGQFSGSTGVSVVGGPGYINAYGEGTAALFVRQTDAGANLKTSQIQQLSGATYFRILNDDFSIKYTPMYFSSGGNTYFAGEVTQEHASGEASIRALGTTSARFVWGDSAAGSDLKYHMAFWDGGSLSFRNLTDGGGVKNTPLTFAANGSSQFNGNVTLTGNVNHILTIEGSGAAFVRLKDTGSSANNKTTDIIQDGGSTIFRHLNDDTTVKTTPMYFGNSGFVVMPNYMFVGEGGGNGQLRINSGSASTSAWVGWYNSSGQRLGYIGDSNTNLLIWLENNACLDISNGAIKLPGWTTATRPASPQWGYFGWNSDTNQLEYYRSGGYHTVMTTLGSDVRWNEVSAVSVIDISLPSGARGIRIKGTWYPASAGQFLCMHVSHDNGASFVNSAASYGWGFWIRDGATQTPGAHASFNYARVGAVVNGSDFSNFDIEWNTTNGAGYSSFWSRAMGWTGTNTTDCITSGFRNSSTAITTVRLLSSLGNIANMRYTTEFY